MLTAFIAVLLGLVLLVWSADRFVQGAIDTANYCGMPPLLIGMLIVGFGTSSPELVVSIIAAHQGNPALAIGNAYGSNISNIALILGLTAVISPIVVQSQVLRKELTILIIVTCYATYQLWDGQITRFDAGMLLLVFGGLVGWAIGLELKKKGQNIRREVNQELESRQVSVPWAVFWLVSGLIMLIVSSRILVWGAVEIAMMFEVSELIIGLTIVAIGTSLPELASSILAARKGEHELAFGNIVGSNLFNTLVVVGIAGSIQPFSVDKSVFFRDASLMCFLTLSLAVFGYGRNRNGRINRYEGLVLLTIYFGYLTYLVISI